MLQKRCVFFPFTSKKGALGDKGLILSSIPSEGIENNLRGMKGRGKKLKITFSSFCPILSLAITARHTCPVFLRSHLISPGLTHAWGKQCSADSPRSTQHRLPFEGGSHLEAHFRNRCEQFSPKAYNAMMSLAFPSSPNRCPQEQPLCRADLAWSDQPDLPTGSRRFPGRNLTSSAFGTSFINSQTLISLCQCQSLGQTSGPFTQHENRECSPGGKLQLTKDKSSYTGSWKMRAGWWIPISEKTLWGTFQWKNHMLSLHIKFLPLWSVRKGSC